MTLQDALQRLNAWKRQLPQLATEQKIACEYYGRLFHPDRVHQLTEDEFRGFLVFKNNKHWTNIQRQSGQLVADMQKLRSALSILLDESRAIEGRLDTLFPHRQVPYIKGLGRAVATPILMLVYPDKYGVYNNTSEAGLKNMGRLPGIKDSESFTKRYLAINKALLDIAAECQIPLYLVDTMFSLIVLGYEFPDEIKHEELGVALESVDSEVFTSARFSLEKHLEEFLLDNWQRTSLGDWLDLHEEDGETAQQFRTDVGPIDILARDKKTGDWMVIELKKDRDNDRAVGQILRYMGWVKTRKAQAKEKVRGIIVVGQLDERLKCALQVVDNVELYNYRVDFQLTKHKPTTS